MKMNNASLHEIIGQLETLFSKFNQKYFGNQVAKPVITVSPDTTQGAFGWCTSWKAWKDGDDSEGYYELNICAEHLNRPFEEVCGTMLHEMVHLLNLQDGVQDTSRGGTYHNKKFKSTAEDHGLIISQHPKYGWCVTTLNEDAVQFVESLGTKGFKLYRDKTGKSTTGKGKGKTQSSSRKYVCPMCNTIIRATKEVSVICADCGVMFEQEEG